MQIKRAIVAAVVTTVALTTAACGSDTSGDGTPGATESPNSGKTKKPPAPIADPDHAVDAPGELDGPLVSADMLIVSKSEISDEMYEQIKALKGVAKVARLSMGQAPIENKLYNVAAVDASTYRNFTERRSAIFQPQWDRIAGGELAMAEGIDDRLPISKNEYLPVGLGDEGKPIHIGAYGPQVPSIDLVVNRSWGEELGMTMDNALVISTQPTTPQALRKPVQEIVGADVTVALLDIATRLGLDPAAVQTAVIVGAYSDAIGTFNYRLLGGGRVAPEPSWVSSHISSEVVPILGKVTCNKFMMPQLKAALAEVVSRGLEDKINPGEYAGCYYPRFIAGSSRLSNHAFGLALDMNVPGNQRGTVGQMDRGVVEAFKKWGFAWGGDWKYTDPMHFELARIVNPG